MLQHYMKRKWYETVLIPLHNAHLVLFGIRNKIAIKRSQALSNCADNVLDNFIITVRPQKKSQVHQNYLKNN